MKSAYLDDMDVSEGDLVICKEALGSVDFTPGQAYDVVMTKLGPAVWDNRGVLVYPSVRFYRQTITLPIAA